MIKDIQALTYRLHSFSGSKKKKKKRLNSFNTNTFAENTQPLPLFHSFKQLLPATPLFEITELSHELLDHLPVNLKCFLKDTGRYPGIRPEHCIGDGDHPRILAVEGGKGDCRRLRTVELKVDHAHGEHKDITFP